MTEQLLQANRARIINLRETEIGPDTVIVDRRTKFGNPYRLGVNVDDPELVIANYRHWLWRSIQTGAITIEELAWLHGKELACWCHPAPCHAHVLASAATWAANQ